MSLSSIPLLEEFISELLKRISDLEAIIVKLQEENAALKSEIARLSAPKKNSSNSSVSPSQDPYRIKRTDSLRPKSDKGIGGQPGHQGTTLSMTATPTQIIHHIPDYCTVCGASLSATAPVYQGKRQVIDLPPIEPEIIEHQLYHKLCACGHCQASTYPSQAHSPISYGPGVMSLSAYLHTRQYISFDRMQELFCNIFHLSLSCGTLVNLLNRFSAKTQPIYEQIQQRISKSPVVGADETGVCVNGKNHWAWAFQNHRYTYIAVNPSRGKKAIDLCFPDGFPHSVMVHDCWKAYFTTNALSHQICIAHLLRELNYLDKRYQNKWPALFKVLLLDALDLKKTDTPKDNLQLSLTNLKERLNKLLLEQIDPLDKEIIAFRDRMLKYKEYLFRFLYQVDVPPDNNGSERAVRTFKVKQKVSGLFRSEEGAQTFAVIRSVVDTVIKSGENVFQALLVIAKTDLAVTE